MRRTAVAFTAFALAAVASPAMAQTESGEFSYSPAEQVRGKAISVTGRCNNGGDTTLKVTVQEGAAGDGNFVFSKAFPSNGNAVNGTIDVPDDAPLGSYVITGECFPGSSQQAFFRKDGTFAVVEKAGATTTTVAEGATTTSSSTTSTTAADGVTTTTLVDEPDELPSSVDDTNTTETTVDEFAGTRKDDDGSTGPLLLILGGVPLVLAVGAIAVALRRNRNAAPDEVIDLDDHID